MKRNCRLCNRAENEPRGRSFAKIATSLLTSDFRDLVMEFTAYQTASMGISGKFAVIASAILLAASPELPSQELISFAQSLPGRVEYYNQMIKQRDSHNKKGAGIHQGKEKIGKTSQNPTSYSTINNKNEEEETYEDDYSTGLQDLQCAKNLANALHTDVYIIVPQNSNG